MCSKRATSGSQIRFLRGFPGEPVIYCVRSTIENRSSYVLNVPGRQTFVSTNNVVFGNKCPMAKDSLNVIATDMVFDFPPEAHV